MSTTHLQRTLHQLIEKTLLPWVRADAPCVLIEAPVVSTPHIQVRHYKGAFLSDSAKTQSSLESYQWPEERLVAHRLPCLCVVLEGDADMRTGITESRARLLSPDAHRYARQTITLNEGTFFVLPPDGVISQAGLHWESARGRGAHSKLLWMTITPTGAVCHVCACRSNEHFVYPFLYVPCEQLCLMMRFLLETMRDQQAHSDEMARSIIKIILLRVDEIIEAGNGSVVDSLKIVRSLEALAEIEKETLASSPPDALTRAHDFISAHFNRPELSPESIARHCYQSPSHLGRLFKSHFGLSVMQFVKQARLQNAENLLLYTDLPVREVLKFSGFRHHAHFTRAFTEQFGSSPQRYRQERRREDEHAAK